VTPTEGSSDPSDGSDDGARVGYLLVGACVGAVNGGTGEMGVTGEKVLVGDQVGEELGTDEGAKERLGA